MSISLKTIGIIAILLLVTGTVLFWTFNKSTNNKVAEVNNESVVITSVPTITTVPVSPTGSSKYTSEFRAKARSAFITSCKLKVGQQYTSACECGADYLAAHYSDAQLEKAYIEYHSGNKIPREVQAAYDACKNK